MDEPPANLSLTPDTSNSVQNIADFESALIHVLAGFGLPTEGIFVPVEQRGVVFRNIESIVVQIDAKHRSNSVYLSKFVAAVGAGLFDAALNYLWDETVSELRKRVAQYDLSYFFDNAVGGQDKRKRLHTEQDLDKIDDSELIHGAKGIELLSDLGFRHLDYIRYMRNWASAAHPNHNEITGLQLLSMAETCIREVIALPISDIAIEIKIHLSNIRTSLITEADAKQIAAFYLNLSREQVSNLAQGYFGIYTRDDATIQTRQNIRLLLPPLWERVDEVTRQRFGIRYGRFVANSEQGAKQLAREFLDTVAGEQYIPDDLRALEIATAMDNLLVAHRGVNNFYTEPPLAREVQRLTGDGTSVPPQTSQTYVLGLVEVFLTNGHGVAWNADPIYRNLLKQLNPDQALVALLSFQEPTIASRLQFNLCRQQFKELVSMMRGNVTAPAVRELIDEIERFRGPLDHMKDDTVFMKRLQPFKTIIG